MGKPRPFRSQWEEKGVEGSSPHRIDLARRRRRRRERRRRRRVRSRCGSRVRLMQD